MSYYNGEYEHSFFIVVESKSHDTTRRFMRMIKNAVDPWFFQTKNIDEIKSARSGDVLKRTLRVHHISYGQDIIIFNEMLRTLIWHYNLLYDVSIRIDDRGTLPKDSRTDLIV